MSELNRSNVITPEEACSLCGVATIDPRNLYNGDCVCPDCADNDAVACEYCDELVPTIDVLTVNGHIRWGARSHNICPDCVDSGRFNIESCSLCGELIDENGLFGRTGRGEAICTDCDSDWYICAGCGEAIHMDDACFRHDVPYCMDCVPNEGTRTDDSRFMGSYYDKPFGIMSLLKRKYEFFVRKEDYTIGIEQETDDESHECDGESYVDDLWYAGGNKEQFIIKRDGSLENGAEIVSNVMTYAYFMHEYPLEKIHEIAKRYGFKAHDTNTCGLHVHIGRESLGSCDEMRELNVAKVMLLVDKFWDEVVKFSRRERGSINEWAGKNNSGIVETDDAQKAIEKAKGTSYSRYRALNLTNKHTIEFRVFRGTLNPNTVRASVQFCIALCEFAKNHSLQECCRAKWSKVVGSKKYAELHAYLIERGLL